MQTYIAAESWFSGLFHLRTVYAEQFLFVLNCSKLVEDLKIFSTTAQVRLTLG